MVTAPLSSAASASMLRCASARTGCAAAPMATRGGRSRETGSVAPETFPHPRAGTEGPTATTDPLRRVPPDGCPPTGTEEHTAGTSFAWAGNGPGSQNAGESKAAGLLRTRPVRRGSMPDRVARERSVARDGPSGRTRPGWQSGRKCPTTRTIASTAGNRKSAIAPLDGKRSRRAERWFSRATATREPLGNRTTSRAQSGEGNKRSRTPPSEDA